MEIQAILAQVNKLSADEKQWLLNEATRAYAAYDLVTFLPYIHAGYDMQWFHQLIATKCQALLEGTLGKNRLMVFLPPQHGKTEVVSRNFPPWALGRNPDLKIVGCSYSSDLATQFSRAIQRTIATQRYAAVFPNTRLGGGKGDSKGYRRNADLFEIVNHQGFYKAVGVGGSLTGTPADIAIIDDPVKDAMEAFSATYRERVWEWYNSVLLTRLHNNSKQLLIMTRWHEDDLAGRILAHEADKWEVISIPALCEVEHDGGLSNRHIDDALWESHHSKESLLEVRARSATVFASLYQQRPVIEGGNIVKRDWFNIITPEAFRRSHLPYTVHFYLDTAYNKRKTTVDNDPSGILAACRIKQQIYLLHAAQVWMEMPDLLRFLPEYIRSHGGTAESVLHVEPKANGLSVIQMLKETTTLNVKQTPAPKDSKEARFRAVTPRIECGRVTIVQDSWTEAFLDEVCAFPAHPHDEFVDILVYALNDLWRDEDIDWSEATKYFLV